MQTKQAISRRDFLQGMAAAAAVHPRSTPFSLWARTASSAREKLFVFAYSDVKLTGGPLRSQQDRIDASYRSDYHPSTQKAYMQDKWPCCSGTTPQVVADYTISAYLRSEDGIYMNLFTPSAVNWTVRGTPAKLIQSTTYPESRRQGRLLPLRS